MDRPSPPTIHSVGRWGRKVGIVADQKINILELWNEDEQCHSFVSIVRLVRSRLIKKPDLLRSW